MRIFVPVLRSDDLLESHCLDVTWSLLSATHALHRLCQRAVVLSLGQSLVLRGIDLTSSEPLQKNKPKRPDKSQQSPEVMGLLIWDARKSQGGGGLLSRVQEEREGLNEPGCFLRSWLLLQRSPTQQGGGEKGAVSPEEARGAWAGPC